MNKSRRMVKQLVSWLLVMTLVCTCAPISVHAAKKVKLNKTSVKLKVGKTVKLKLKNNKKKVKWSSVNKKVATVNKSGLVKAKKKGKTRIIAKVKKKKYICKITVEEKKAETEEDDDNNSGGNQQGDGSDEDDSDDDQQEDGSDEGDSDDDKKKPNPTAKPELTPTPLMTPVPWETAEPTKIPWETANPWETTGPTQAPWETANPWETAKPSRAPWETANPWETAEPSRAPWETANPWETAEPSRAPWETSNPGETVKPTLAPWETSNPGETVKPTLAPWETANPGETVKPTLAPWETSNPGETAKPTSAPWETSNPGETTKPTSVPTAVPTVKPTSVPTAVPTVKPTLVPTAVPTVKPTSVPTAVPTVKPTAVPTVKPTSVPTAVPTVKPTLVPTAVPTVKPTLVPTAVPTVKPTSVPTAVPTVKPTPTPTSTPTVKPTPTPTVTPGTDLPSGATVFTMGSKKLAIGMTEAAVKAVLGSGYRTGKSPQGFDTIAYNTTDYREYLLIYLKDGKVVGICGIGKTMSFGDAIAGQNGNNLSWSNVSDYKTTSGRIGAKKSAGAGSEMAYAFLDALGDNTIYCIQVFDTSKVSQTEDMIYKTTNLSYDAVVTASIAAETGHMLNAFRTYRSMKTYYFNDGLAQCAQQYCNSITASKINARNADSLLDAMLECNVDPMAWGEVCYYDAADAISFANSLIELDSFYSSLTDATYCYIGVGMAATGSHTYMAVDFVDEY